MLDNDAQQITSSASPRGRLPRHFGRDHSARPRLTEAIDGERFSPSDACISRNARRPSLTAVQRIEAANEELPGYPGADFDLLELRFMDDTINRVQVR